MKPGIQLLAVAFMAVSNLAPAQNAKTTISVIDFFLPSASAFQERQNKQDSKIISLDINYGEIYSRVTKLQQYVTEVFANDSRFKLLDRSTLNLVNKERELQKSEDFIDGYVVQQGTAVGADYLLVGDFEISDLILTIKLYSVADQKIAGQESVSLKKQLYSNFLSVKTPAQEAAFQLKEHVFPLYIKVVEIAEGKKEAKPVLIAGGTKRNLKQGVKLDIKTPEQREVDGETVTYYRTIGWGEVEQVEDQNFSLLAVRKGGAEVKALLDQGAKVYCSFIQD